jgi:hypothetical protein
MFDFFSLSEIKTKLLVLYVYYPEAQEKEKFNHVKMVAVIFKVSGLNPRKNSCNGPNFK